MSQLSLKPQRHYVLHIKYISTDTSAFLKMIIENFLKKNELQYIVSVKLLGKNSHLNWFLKHTIPFHHSASFGSKYRISSSVYAPAFLHVWHYIYRLVYCLMFHWFISLFCRFISRLSRLKRGRKKKVCKKNT